MQFSELVPTEGLLNSGLLGHLDHLRNWRGRHWCHTIAVVEHKSFTECMRKCRAQRAADLKLEARFCDGRVSLESLGQAAKTGICQLASWALRQFQNSYVTTQELVRPYVHSNSCS